MALAGTVAFTSCSKDDDDKNSCATCELKVLDSSVTSKYCDNGDGTMTVTTDGQENTVELDGVSFDTFISQFKRTGATCK